MTAYPFSPSVPADPAQSLPLELDEPLEFIARDDYVLVTPTFMRKPFYANVEAVVGAHVIVSHEAFGYVTDHDASEVQLILKASARAALRALDEAIYAEAERLPADWSQIAKLEAARWEMERSALEAARAASAS